MAQHETAWTWTWNRKQLRGNETEFQHVKHAQANLAGNEKEFRRRRNEEEKAKTAPIYLEWSLDPFFLLEDLKRRKM
jgi:hypothetical protein